MNWGILLWLERRNRFKESSEVIGRLAMLSKLGAAATGLEGIVEVTEWQLPHMVVATRSPDAGLP